MCPPSEIGKKYVLLFCVPARGKLLEIARNGARRIFVPTNPDLAIFWGGMDSALFGYFLVFFRSMEKMAWDGPKWGQEDFCSY